MHALGWWHEQQRGDRDEYVKVWEDRCKWTGSMFTVNQGKLGGNRPPWQDQKSPYDIASIMHYSVTTCRKGSEHVITKPDGSPLILKKTSSLSEQDIWQINQVYKCDLTPTTQAPTTSPKPTTATTPDPSLCQNCPSEWSPFNIRNAPKCLISKGKHASSKAHSICQSDNNSQLPLPLSPKEDDQYEAAFLQLDSEAKLAALDLSDKDKEGTFVRLSDGKKPTWLNWYGSEPNNTGDEDYVVQYLKRSGSKTWNDQKATSTTNVFCYMNCPDKGKIRFN